MAFAIKAEVCDLRAKTFAFTAQKTMYGGKHVASGDTVFVFASENEGRCSRTPFASLCYDLVVSGYGASERRHVLKESCFCESMLCPPTQDGGVCTKLHVEPAMMYR